MLYRQVSEKKKIHLAELKEFDLQNAVLKKNMLKVSIGVSFRWHVPFLQL